MKIRLWCRIFGHKFIQRDYEVYGWSKHQINWCIKCGLNKKEISQLHSSAKEKSR